MRTHPARRTLPTVLAALLLLAALAAPEAQAKSIEGFDFPETRTVGGETLSLVGVGLRTKWFVSVYVIGVYQKTVKKDAGHLVNSDEPKYLWIHMLRGISGDKMRAAIDDGLEANSSDEIRTRIAPLTDKLKAAFPERIRQDMDIGFAYTPGKGTALSIGKNDKVSLPGKDFMVAMWSIWFGRKPADKALKKGVLE